MTELERYQQWCEQAPLNEAGRAALAAMQNDETERKRCFGAELQFGTAGIRGIMGIGTNRLNDFTVRRTAQGLAAWLTSTELPQRCAIGYDSRHNSDYAGATTSDCVPGSGRTSVLPSAAIQNGSVSACIVSHGSKASSGRMTPEQTRVPST